MNVHIDGGSKHLVERLEGATRCTSVVLAATAEMRASGYPGYRALFNSETAVRELRGQFVQWPQRHIGQYFLVRL